MTKSKSIKKHNNRKIIGTKKLETKKSPKKVEKTDLHKTLKASHLAAVIYACVIIPVLMFGGFATRSLALKIIDSVLLAGLTVLTVLILKSYYRLSKKTKFTHTMSLIMIIFTIIIGIFNILKLYLFGPQIILYIVTWVTAAILLLFGISLFKMKKLSFLFSATAIFYVLMGAFNASLVMMILLPSLYVATAVIEAFLFARLMKKV